MSEEQQKEEISQPNTVSVSVEEYNGMKAKLQGLQTFQIKLQEKETELEKLRNEINEVKSKKAPNKEEIEQQLRNEFAEKLTSTEAQAKQFQSKLKALTVTDKVMSVIGDKVLPDARKFLRMEVEKECDLEGDFDSGQIIVKDEQGNTRWSPHRPNERMSIEEYSDVLKSRYPTLFQSNARSAEPVNGGTKFQSNPAQNKTGITWEQYESLTPEQQKNVSLEDKKRLLSGR
jgi:hypothetical protein